MLLAHSHRAADEDAQHRQREADSLRPGAAHQIGAEAVIAHADNRERAGLNHGHGVQKRGNGRGRHAGRGQPAMQRKNRRFNAKAKEAKGKHGQNQRHGRVPHRGNTADGKVGGAAEMDNRNQR